MNAHPQNEINCHRHSRHGTGVWRYPGITPGRVVATLLGEVWLPWLGGNNMRASPSTSSRDLHMARLSPHARQVYLPATATGRVDGLARVLATAGKERQAVVLTQRRALPEIGLPPADAGARHRRGTANGLPKWRAVLSATRRPGP